MYFNGVVTQIQGKSAYIFTGHAQLCVYLSCPFDATYSGKMKLYQSRSFFHKWKHRTETFLRNCIHINFSLPFWNREIKQILAI